MPMRMSGLMSGMDTESVIQELVAARQTKVDKQKKAQTKLEWRTDALKELNTKLKNLQSKYLSNMRFTDAYLKKTTKVSNSNVVSVITGDNAVNGTQELEVKQLAKSGYLTGGKINAKDGAATTMKDLGLVGEDDEPTKLTLKIGAAPAEGQEDTRSVKEINITKDTSISDVLTQLKNAGLNASFDAGQGRFFISSSATGAKNDFELTAAEGDAASQKVLSGLGLDVNAEGDAKANRVKGQDSIITLNGATFTSDTNTHQINGLTITANQVTAEGEKVTLTTEQDTSGIYDMIKNFLKEYNSIINEMDKLYNAEAASGYEPLTDDEKYAMSDKEVEKYEQKIKDSILRRDETVSNVSSGLKDVMAGGIEIGGRTYYLSDFGINTLGYFSAADNEKNAYHIDGDEDDADTSGKANALKGLITSDPSLVTSFFTKLSQNLYGKMSDMSKSVEGYRSFGNFYDDKKLKSDYDDYTSKIADLEEKLNAYEDRMYSKFSKMETALAKMQSKTSALAGLLGGSV